MRAMCLTPWPLDSPHGILFVNGPGFHADKPGNQTGALAQSLRTLGLLAHALLVS